MPEILSPRTKTRILSPLEKELEAEGLLVELERIMLSDEFEDDLMHDVILGEMPDAEEFEETKRKGKKLKTANMPVEIAVLYNNPVLTREQEHHLFRKYNFYKYQAYQLLRKSHGFLVQVSVKRALRNAVAVKKMLADCNIRLAVSVSKKHAKATDQMHRLWEIVSEANLCIMKSITCFDFTRNVKFSTYSTWGIRNNLGRASRDYREQQARYSSGHDDEVFDSNPRENTDAEDAERRDYLRQTVKTLLESLDVRERKIIRMSMLDGAMTLEKVGMEFGITKERVRQIKARGIHKMREMVRSGGVTLNGFLQEFVHVRDQ